MDNTIKPIEKQLAQNDYNWPRLHQGAVIKTNIAQSIPKQIHHPTSLKFYNTNLTKMIIYFKKLIRKVI